MNFILPIHCFSAHYVECGTLKRFTVRLPLSQFVYSYFCFYSQIVKDELALLLRRTAVELSAVPRITYSFCYSHVLYFLPFNVNNYFVNTLCAFELKTSIHLFESVLKCNHYTRLPLLFLYHLPVHKLFGQ
jgi:hypothetical protein